MPSLWGTDANMCQGRMAKQKFVCYAQEAKAIGKNVMWSFLPAVAMVPLAVVGGSLGNIGFPVKVKLPMFDRWAKKFLAIWILKCMKYYITLYF